MLSKLVTPSDANSSIESMRVIPSRWSSVSGLSTSSIAIEAVQDLVGLQGHHAAQRDALISHVLEARDAVGVSSLGSILGRRRRAEPESLRRRAASMNCSASAGSVGDALPTPGQPSSASASGS